MFKKVCNLAAGALMVLVAGCGNSYLPGTPGYAEAVAESDVPPGSDRPALEAGDVSTGDGFGDAADGGDAPSADVVGDEDVMVIADRPQPTDRPTPEDGADGGDAGEDVAMDVTADRPSPDVPVTDGGMDAGMDSSTDHPDSGPAVDAADVVDVPVDTGADRPMPTDTGPVCSGTVCSGVCRDLATDVNNCGACGNVCPAGQSCAASACVCPTGQMMCGGVCRDVQSDGDNCGACGNRCPPGQVCSMGSCSSGCGTHTDCSGDCVDTQTDPMNCGACGNRCSAVNASSACMSGACRFTCSTGYGNCDGNAVNGCEADLAVDTRNCGACGTVCGPYTNAVATCSSSACTARCNAGYGNCDGMLSNGCEAALNTPPNCGRCGNVCAGATPICNGGTCVQCTADRDCAAGYRCNTSTNVCYVVVPRMRSVYVLGRGITSVYMRVSSLALGPPAYIVTPDRGGERGTWRANPCLGGFSASPSMIVCPEIDVTSLLPPGTTWDRENYMMEDDAMVGGATLCGTTNDCNGCWVSPTWSCSTTTCIAGGDAPRDNVVQDARNPTGGAFTVHQLRPQGIPGARRAPCIPTS